MLKEPLITIVVPTRNEKRDIGAVLERLTALNYPRKEIIVVDDSEDKTASIVRRFEHKGVQLLNGKNRGRCSARNLGIQNGKGEIVVVLNADVFLPVDFLDRVLVHYRGGADYVLVECRISNPGSVYARFIQALHESTYRNADWIEWTEGFSCRRSCALAVGLFPELPFPIVSGEDGFFGEKLRKRGFKKFIDRSIVVRHVGPCHLKEFWEQRKERGSPMAKGILEEYSAVPLLIWLSLRNVLLFSEVITLFPIVWRAACLSSFSRRKVLDFIPFCFLYALERVAFVIAGWSGFRILLRYNSEMRKRVEKTEVKESKRGDFGSPLGESEGSRPSNSIMSLK